MLPIAQNFIGKLLSMNQNSKLSGKKVTHND